MPQASSFSIPTASVSGAIWYPCAGDPKVVALGNLAVRADFGLTGVKDCPVSGPKRPLIIFSHGRGGWFGGHHDTAEALADAGFIVAAINHPGDTANDSSRRNTLSVWASRPADMVRLLDFMLNDWKNREVIDPAKIGFFGFSLGGYTGLVLVGANPDMRRVAERCTEKTAICEELHNGATLPDLPHDARIKAAVLADAAITAAFTQESLAGIQIPLQIWRSELGGYGVDAGGTARVSRILPGKPELNVVPAGHYAFLAPCSEQLAITVPSICTDDPPNFDRAAFHRDFNASLVGFFREHLVNNGTR
ncbi:MAG TPA: alpha/beta fold hydrolase [Pyrinomonadaceae bacterium]|nr:alpha/beta fold hydrolase [Pyrinomonadaceae bacterium]